MAIVGLKDVDRMLSRIDRRATRERQQIIRDAARRTLVVQVKADASRSPGRAGARLARATTVRLGKQGAVLVGPRTGRREDKGKAWFRAIFIIGSPRRTVGGAKASEIRTYTSTSKQYAKAGGVFARSTKARDRVLMANKAQGWAAVGPWTVPAIPPNPFVRTGEERARPAFVAALRQALFSTEDT